MIKRQFAKGRSYLSNELKLRVAVFFLSRQDGVVVVIHPRERNFTDFQHRLKTLALNWTNPKFCHCSAGCVDKRNVFGRRDLMSAHDLILGFSRVVVKVPSHIASPMVEQRILAREAVA